MSQRPQPPEPTPLEALLRCLVDLSYDGVATWDKAKLKNALEDFKESIKAEVKAELFAEGNLVGVDHSLLSK